MIEQIIFKKKKKKNALLLRIANPDEDTIHQDLNEVVKRLFKIFKYHIGKENSISAYDLFVQVFNIDPNSIDVFTRNYMWNVLTSIIKKLRSNEELFVIISHTSLYVLQSENESAEFKKRIDTSIHSLENLKTKADTWVNDKSWENI